MFLSKVDIKKSGIINVYQSLRNEVFHKARELSPVFDTLGDKDKLIFELTNYDMIKNSAKACFLILNTRNNILYK